MTQNRVILDPRNTDITIRQLSTLIDFNDETREHVRRAIELYPCPTILSLDETNAALFTDPPLTDRFTFDIETDELVLFSRDTDSLVDALIEMAMYLCGFSTLLGNEDTWVIEFAIGAWKLVKNHIKQRLNIPGEDAPRAVIGLPPATAQNVEYDFSFRDLVSRFDRVAFDQMIILAARDDLAIYFPPQTHPKTLGLYLHTRRAIHEVAESIDLSDHQIFNARLLQKIQALERLFTPANLALPDKPNPKDCVESNHESSDSPVNNLESSPDPSLSSHSPKPPSLYDPFSAFMEELFADDSEKDEPD